ncbi:methyltransferase domain-containing protein [Microlunatus capsulatus]|uniref:SAM-dependent methyltransferase n=1 Tax=Microlunatus capsulatus TaxID=99117 RepID=A0ABS4ZBH4_9ACTN|nr:methyltransferase domain-containing protein [Microlunatus capsulatus]MBP2418382.1 SAM-dependent methyltransferase [Microlunatus capsulatus]
MVEARRRRSVSATFLLDLLAGQLRGLDPAGAPLDVVDLGGGTGGVATALAGHGHRVTVIDPSPDALASLERRTAEAGLEGRIVGRQGDAADLVDVVGERSVDVVVCHRVLEVVESPAEALTAVAAVLRPGGALSLLASQRRAAVLGHALAGHLGLARRAWADPRRFDHEGLVDLLAGAGFDVQASHGIGALADHVAEQVLEAEPGALADLTALEAEVSTDPAFRALAPQVHLFARVGLTTPAAVD